MSGAFRAAIVAALVFAAGLPRFANAKQAASGAAVDPGAPGPYAIGHTSLMLLDGSRDRDSGFGGRRIFVSVLYPVDAASVTPDTPPAIFPLDPVPPLDPPRRWPDSVSPEWEALGFPPTYEDAAPSSDGPFPLVLFSTGAAVKYYLYLFLNERLASHGYVVATVQPSGDGIVPWEAPPPMGIRAWNRPRDLTFALDALLERTRAAGDLLAGLVDPDLIVASGHSLGGYAALVLAGGDDSVCDGFDPALDATCGPSAPDPRIRAVLPVDPSSHALRWSELERITTPAICVSQELAFHAAEVPQESPAIWARQHAAISAHPNYRVEVARAHHFSFTNNCATQELLFRKGLIPLSQLINNRTRPWCSTDTPQVEVARLTARYQLAFLMTHLQRDARYQEILTPGWAHTVETLVEFFVTEPDLDPAAECSDCFAYFPHQPGSGTEAASRDDPFARQ